MLHVFNDKPVLTYNYQHGTQTISLDEIESALSSDFDGATPPIKKTRLTSCLFYCRSSRRIVPSPTAREKNNGAETAAK